MRRHARPGTNIGYTPRTWGRFAVLIVMAVLLVLFAIRVRNPGGWAWLASDRGKAATAPDERKSRERRSIDPDKEKLRGAADREPFLLENPNALLRDERWQKQRRDADARYELLLYAKETPAGSLEHDARHDVVIADLLDQPQKYRGEVLHIRGDLLWVRKMELNRPGLGITECYQALLTVQGPDKAFWVLFTKPLPTAALSSAGNTIYIPNVEFAGYFYKLLAVEPLPGHKEPRILPVLVGSELVLPGASTPGDDLSILGAIFLAAALPVALIVVLACWLYRGHNRRLREKLAAVKLRVEARSAAHVAQLDEPLDQSSSQPN